MAIAEQVAVRSVAVGLTLLAFDCLALCAANSSAQQVTVGTPFHQLSDGFFEHFGTSWSLNGRGWNASFGSPNLAAPQFGGFQPGAGATFGVAGMLGGVRGQLNANFSQGFRQSLVSQTPSVTLQNGVPGYFSDTSQSPFVISYIPVVGNYPGFGGFPPVGSLWPVTPPPYRVLPQGAAVPGGTAAVQEALRRAKAGEGQGEQTRLPDPRAEDVPVRREQPAAPAAPIQASSAARAAPSVAEARRLHAAETASQNEEAMKYVELARGAEASGKPSVAKVYYQMAARRASGGLKAQILSRLEALQGHAKDDP